MDVGKTERKLMDRIGKEEMHKIFSFPCCEIDPSFLGFMENYEDLEEKIPKDFTIIDVGCYLGLQAEYFTEHKAYIGIEPIWDYSEFSGLGMEVNIKDFFHTTPNSTYMQDTVASFIEKWEEYAERFLLDKEKVFVICSAVPSNETDDIEKFFPYVRIAYPERKTIERFPSMERDKKIPMSERQL